MYVFFNKFSQHVKTRIQFSLQFRSYEIAVWISILYNLHRQRHIEIMREKEQEMCDVN
jgi:hypothetical protein